MAEQERLGLYRQGLQSLGKVRQVRPGLAGYGELGMVLLWFGRSGTVWMVW